MEKKEKGVAVGGSERGREEVWEKKDYTSADKSDLNKGGRVSSMNKQVGKKLGLDLKILVLAAQASEAKKLGVGYGVFRVGGVGEEKVDVEMGIRGFEEERGGERVGGEVNGERDIK